MASTVSPSTVAAWSGARAPRITVVGAGMAGLNAAYQLRKHGLVATVREARARTGGRMHTIRRAGLDLDLGGQWVNRDHRDMIDLADELGVGLFNEAATTRQTGLPPTAYYYDGRRIDEGELIEWLRPIARQIAWDNRRLDNDYDTAAPQLDALSAADYLDLHADRIGHPIARELLEASVRTEYGVEPAGSSALQLIWNLVAVQGDRIDALGGVDETFSIEGGSEHLTDAIAAQLPGQIESGQRLASIEGAADGPYRLTFVGSDGRAIVDQADFVIVAIPMRPLRRVALEVELPAEFRSFIAEVDLGRDEKVVSLTNSRVWRQNAGFATGLWTDLGFAGAWEATVRQPNRENASFVYFVGGDEVDGAAMGTAREAGERFVAATGAAIPGIEAATRQRFVRTNWHRQALTGGAYTSFRPGQLTRFAPYFWVEANRPAARQETVFGRLLFIGEHLSDEYYGYMNGAAQTGRLAAEALLRRA